MKVQFLFLLIGLFYSCVNVDDCRNNDLLESEIKFDNAEAKYSIPNRFVEGEEIKEVHYDHYFQKNYFFPLNKLNDLSFSYFQNDSNSREKIEVSLGKGYLDQSINIKYQVKNIIEESELIGFDSVLFTEDNASNGIYYLDFEFFNEVNNRLMRQREMFDVQNMYQLPISHYIWGKDSVIVLEQRNSTCWMGFSQFNR